jgi:acetoin utilization deacetylase AcuC-like enzyme
MMQREGKAHRIVILDLDVHQGNGTAFIFQDSPEVFTLSIHGANNFPFKKESSDLDLELPDGADDGHFLEVVEEGIRQALGAGPFDMAFYLAGADPYQGDRLGKLAVSKEGLRERDRMVLHASRTAGVPVAVVMSGGYARRIEDSVDIHFNTVRVAAKFANLP